MELCQDLPNMNRFVQLGNVVDIKEIHECFAFLLLYDGPFVIDT